MSEITDFYPSWQGCSAFGGTRTLARSEIPIVFRPTDISGCAIWMNATDADSVTFNNLLQVSAWVNRGTLGGQFDASGAEIVEYGVREVNGLNTLTFRDNAFMAGQFALNFQPRSFFLVTRERSYPSNVANPLFSSDTNNAQETFVDRNGTFTYFLGKHPSPIPSQAFETETDYRGYASLLEFIMDTDVSNNWMGINGVQFTPIYDVAATGFLTTTATYFLGGYFSGSTVAADQDYCEMILYDHALPPNLREQVEKYLIAKWNLAEPPFAPSWIANLQVWFDASNTSSIVLDVTNTYVESVSNLGIGGGSATTNSTTNVMYSGTQTINGLNVLEVKPQSALVLPWTKTSNDTTFFVVIQPVTDLAVAAAPQFDFMSAFGNTGFFQPVMFYDSGTAKFLYLTAISGTSIPLLGGDSTNYTGAPIVIMMRLSATTANNEILLQNAALSLDLSSAPSFAQTLANYYIGATANGGLTNNEYWLAELLVYDRALTDTEVSKVSTYLVDKWNLL